MAIFNSIVNPPILWLIAGSILCLIEFFFPTAFVALMMGFSAIVVALVSLALPQFSLQVILWLVTSCAFTFLSRPLLTPKHRVSRLGEDYEAETLTEIPPGKTGRVLYEGNSWRAKCEDEQSAISPGQKVYVVRREGNTLVVLPQNILLSE